MLAVRVGYCCTNLSLPSRFKTTTLTWCINHPNECGQKLAGLYEHNFTELARVIKWNILNDVWLYRISSDLNPLADHSIGVDVFQSWVLESSALHTAKDVIMCYLKLGGRLTCHPAQHVSIGTESEGVLEHSLRNLIYHGQLFDALDLPRSRFAPINIHASGGKDPLPRISRYRAALDLLPESVSTRLTFEVEDRGFWGAANLRRYFPNVPIVFDTLHHNCNSFGLTQSYAFNVCAESWDVASLIHHSEGLTGALDRRHSDYIVSLPDLPSDVELE